MALESTKIMIKGLSEDKVFHQNLAKYAKGLLDAYVEAGFSEENAMRLVTVQIDKLK